MFQSVIFMKARYHAHETPHPVKSSITMFSDDFKGGPGWAMAAPDFCLATPVFS